jgi:hypothetical protein
MEPKLSTEYDGKKRLLFPKDCVICKTVFWIPKNQIPKRNTCSFKCRDLNNQKRERVTCATCKSGFDKKTCRIEVSKSGLHFCSRKCKDEAQLIENGLLSYSHYTDGHSKCRERAFRKLEKKCLKCGYDKDERMLDVDHIDNSRDNNAMSNFQVLCVWCHALKTRKVQFHVNGAVAQLGEQLDRNQQVVGS